MTEETAANPVGGDETRVEQAPLASEAPASEANAPAGGGDALADPQHIDADAAVAEPEDEFEEVERGDKKYRVPKALKGELLMHADYTRKTMELAEQRRALEAAKAEIERAQALTTDERRAYAKLETLNETVAQYEQVDWDALEVSDPQEAARHWRTYQTALNQRNTAVQLLQQHESLKSHQAQQEAAKRREDFEGRAQKEIPNWTPARRQELEQFASQYGYTPDMLAANPRVEDYQLLHYATEGFKFIQRQKAAARAAAQNAVKPAPEVGGTAAAGVDPKSLSMEQYIAARQAGKI